MRVVLTVASEKLPAGLTEVFLRSIIRETCLAASPRFFGGKRGVRVEVVFVTDKKIAKLNRDYRGKDKPTDVLSFGEFEDVKQLAKVKVKTLDLGTLVLSLPFIKRSAKEDGVSWKREFVFVFAHGILHLLGHDHGEVMFRIQDEITAMLS